ncbi:hypothetical protein [Bradyrhizobium sp. AZCC 2289]|uniref:hypothetical protein n=1 Tax=Bradyrhizobium sp. AZCC 2289 TaxID=3117026 RepID=UPI002FF2434C
MRERGQIDIVRSATCVDTDDKRMAIRRTADIAAKAVVGIMVYGMLASEGLADSISPDTPKMPRLDSQRTVESGQGDGTLA